MRSNFAVSTKWYFNSTFTAKSFYSSERSYSSFADGTYMGFAFSLAGEAQLSSVKSWSSLTARDYTRFARSWTRDLLFLCEVEVDFSIQVALEADLASQVM